MAPVIGLGSGTARVWVCVRRRVKVREFGV